jgi:hypothetical protein
MAREEALKEISSKPYEFSEELVDYTIRKLGLSVDEFQEILNQEPKSFEDYSTYYPMMKLFKFPIKAATDLGLLPSLLYQKYLA